MDDLEFYIFFDRIIGLALLHHVQLGITFDPILVLMLAELKVNLEDIKESGRLPYKNMKSDVDNYAVSMLTGHLIQDDENKKEAKVLIQEYSTDLVDETIIQIIDKKVTNIKNGFDCIFGTSLRMRTFFQTIDPSHLDPPLDIVICWEQEDI